MPMSPPPEWLICAAGVAQVVLALASVAIPRALGWREQTQKLGPLTRQVFWTYAGYIWASNLSFGLLSALLPGSLVSGTSLAAAVSGFVAIWWAARLTIQFAYFDRTDAPGGLPYRLAEAALVLLFLALTLIYGAAALANFGGGVR
jgi:hypothetical protein